MARAGEAVATLTTAWNDEAGAYTAQTAADALPYGTYDVRETATNGSYLLTDGEPRTFEVRTGGEIVSASADGAALEFRRPGGAQRPRALQEERDPTTPASWSRSPSRTRPPARRTCW